MFHKSFIFQLSIRILFITGTLAAILWLVFFSNYYFTIVGAFLLLILQVILLIQYFTGILNDVYRFSESLAHGEYGINFPLHNKRGKLQEIYGSFNRAIAYQNAISIQKEAAFHLFRTILEKVNFGVIVIEGERFRNDDTRQEILFMNDAASALLDAPAYKYWHRLRKHVPHFAQKISSLDQGGKTFFELFVNKQEIQLTVEVQPVKSSFYNYLIVSVNNIKDEIEQKETEAWNKLIQVLSHEILNSITPINSLADTLHLYMESHSYQEIVKDEFDDMKLAVHAIKKRAEGLMDFVRDYRRMAELPSPDLNLIPVKDLLLHVKGLMMPLLRNNKVQLAINYPGPRKAIKIDEKLIEQVLINLVTNSVYALEQTGHPRIEIRTRENEHYFFIEVEDNGKGIPEKNMEKIFLPFFTTREQGSGIGLTICKNIMRMHGGSLFVKSEVNKFTLFTLAFKH